ncbi:hypothetical protein [Parabacteroides distasonis]|uniref:hypothetical protein n=1 Tax=Parabacteroides distasonis TaxID=823 RepID=UPI00189ACF00|nr:hypothetical protein [Parabacteroides distasonis]MDB9049913.1 hypothetical protein [Parabacteroides distasonis]MDB9058070.1 hypothetical protein [Parabacteroides distasonis]MDB9086406.1 hypothetical protein [Parabacteroides distasonis]
MKDSISLRNEREILIIAMKELISAKHCLASINDDNGCLSEIYRKTFIDVEMQIGDICSEIGGMVGYTVYSDLCEGLEI